MAKKRLKNDHLAKLRQFKKGMDVEEFLSSEHRQVIRALEESYVIGDDLSPYATNDALNSAISSIVPVVSGVHAIKTTPQTGTGNVSFDSWYCPPSAGTFSGTVFRPAKNGVYWIETTFLIEALTASGARIDFDIIKEPASVLSTYSYQANPANETSISLIDANDSASGARNPVISRHVYSIGNLTTTSGVFFKFTITSTTGSLFKMMCKIYRIGD